VGKGDFNRKVANCELRIVVSRIVPLPPFPHLSRHRELLTILLFVCGVLVGAALLSPLLFAGAQGLLHYGEEHDWGRRAVLGGLLTVLQKNNFPSYFDRAALLLALAGLPPLLRHLRIEWAMVLGKVGPARGFPQLGVGFALAVGFLILMGALCWQSGIYHLQKNGHLSPGGPLLSGFAVATLEEFLFRGVMLGILLRSLGQRGAVFWTTCIFASLHFLKPPDHDALPAEAVQWWSGFWIIPQLFRGFGEWHDLVGEFLLLAGVGWALARARLATGGLWAGIGLHAGWVAGMKSFGQITTTTKAFHQGAFFPWFVENHCKAIVSPFVGIAPLLAILITGVVMLLLIRWLWSAPWQNESSAEPAEKHPSAPQ